MSKKRSGFSLVELMVILAVIALLILASAPITGAWVRDAERAQTEGALNEAFGRAKSAALRNQAAATGAQPAAAVCVSTTAISVREGTSAALPNCTTPSGNQLWQSPRDGDVSILAADDSAVSCFCFTNRGQLTDTDCSGCETSTELKIGGHDVITF